MTKTVTLSDKHAKMFVTLIEVGLDDLDYHSDYIPYEAVKDNVWEQLTGKKRE